MHGAQDFLEALSVVLCVAAVTTVVFQKLRQPVVLGYLLAGLIVGPHVPIPLVADREVVQTLSELGVVLLMFSLGLEFSLRRLLQVGATATVTAVVQCSAMLWLGFALARAFGWTFQEALFTGAIAAISSTTIIAKAFDEQNVRGRLRDLVVGVLVVEDLIAILLMALLTAVASGAGLSAGELALTVGKLVGFLVGLVGIGLLVVPRAVRALVRLGRSETILVGSMGVCFAVSLLAHRFGYSVALGAFLAGALVAESGEHKRIEPLVEPVRDVFAAIFFVSVGMLIEPRLVAEHLGPIAALTAAVIVGKVGSVALGAFLTGNGTALSIRAGMSLAQIGEFSFIIAALGLSLGAVRDFLYPVAVAVSAITTLTTPFLIRGSAATAVWVERKLPLPLQTYASLYGSWIERLRRPGERTAAGATAGRLTRLLAVDAALLAALIAGGALALPSATRELQAELGLDAAVAHGIVLAVAFALATPFCVGIMRVASRLGTAVADRVLPGAPPGAAPLAAAPRRALELTLRFAIVLLVGLPLLAVTQPFLPGFEGALLLVLASGALGAAFWRSATDLQGHVRAGAQAIAEALAAQSHAKPESALLDLHSLLPGLGEPQPVEIEEGSGAEGRSLADLNLRGRTGATVIAILRGAQGVVAPGALEVLRAGDVLALAGSREAIDAARVVLAGGRAGE